MEAERSIGRRRRKVSTGQGIVIGVATVAGLGLLSKLVSFLRRGEKPQKLDDADIETLEAVLSGDAAKGTLPPTTAEVHIFANLENDEPANGHELASPPSSKQLDPEQDDAAEEVADPLPTEDSEPSPEQAHAKEIPHSNGEALHQGEGPVALHTEGEGKIDGPIELDTEDKERELDSEKEESHVEDAEQQLPTADVVELQTGDEGKPDVEDAVELQAEGEAKQLNGDVLEGMVEDAGKLHSEEAEI
jgi:hypothetical protein